MAALKIFVATDGSAPAEAAELVRQEMGNCMAACFGECEIIAATVIPPREGSIVEVPFRGRCSLGQRVLPTKEMEEAAEELVAEAGSRIKQIATNPGVKVRAMVLRSATPAQGILDFIASESGCAYLILGHRGHGGFKKLMLGSVSTEVLHTAACPVVIVKD